MRRVKKDLDFSISTQSKIYEIFACRFFRLYCDAAAEISKFIAFVRTNSNKVIALGKFEYENATFVIYGNRNNPQIVNEIKRQKKELSMPQTNCSIFYKKKNILQLFRPNLSLSLFYSVSASMLFFRRQLVSCRALKRKRNSTKSKKKKIKIFMFFMSRTRKSLFILSHREKG